ncbi:AzlC family ABC transporter permease [Alkalicoccobacillus murimartini]|uniref:4-azaleucine resistance transporter AzlC n=1 Tax=Alkalicoccobacillus murimartini TaxID=171685 RepID=A0ABT9YCY2_9BACI|nr:AzlC family ABC transporter permease [Alkalicoccobacillus murimartini]MDQ0205717.1 4-azaleucine resistance transporter AzlC [Alkalicoccobacillus murimartini]
MELQKTDVLLNENDTYLQGFKDCVPTLFGYMSVGFAFGIVGTASNLSVWEIACLSILVYAGSAQFIICALMVAQAPIAAIILTTFVVNLRHLLLCLTIAPYFKQYSLLKNIGIGALVTDETFGVATTKASKQLYLHDKWMNGLNITAYLCWIAVTILGAVLGQWISNPEALGLDYALAAMFVALLILQLENVLQSKIKHYLLVMTYVILLMVGLSMIMPSHIAVLLSTVIAATIGVVTDK